MDPLGVAPRGFQLEPPPASLTALRRRVHTLTLVRAQSEFLDGSVRDHTRSHPLIGLVCPVRTHSEYMTLTAPDGERVHIDYGPAARWLFQDNEVTHVGDWELTSSQRHRSLMTYEMECLEDWSTPTRTRRQRRPRAAST